MGFSRHWYRPAEIAPEVYGLLRADFLRILQKSGIAYAGWNGKAAFRDADPEDFRFNGRVPEDCETFSFPRVLAVEDWMPYETFDGVRLYHQFCKTRQLPYDTLVQRCLVAGKMHLGRNLQVSEDDAPVLNSSISFVRDLTGRAVEWRTISEEIAVREPWPPLAHFREP